MPANSRQSAPSATPAVLLLLAALWLLALVSGLGVVASTHEVRKQVNTLETLRREAAQLEVEWGQYLLEQSTWAAYSRIEVIASEKLDMIPVTVEQTVMVTAHD